AHCVARGQSLNLLRFYPSYQTRATTGLKTGQRIDATGERARVSVLAGRGQNDGRLGPMRRGSTSCRASALAGGVHGISWHGRADGPTTLAISARGGTR